MGVTQTPDGKTPVDQDDAQALIPGHINNREQLNEWEALNVREGEQWAFERKHEDLLTIAFMQTLHKKMFGNTWYWAGNLRTKETHPVGSSPEDISVNLRNLREDVQEQTRTRTWSLQEIAARLHHRLVSIHPFPNGNGRFARTLTDLFLEDHGLPRFVWGEDIGRSGRPREAYIGALRAADGGDLGPLFALLRVNSFD